MFLEQGGVYWHVFCHVSESMLGATHIFRGYCLFLSPVSQSEVQHKLLGDIAMFLCPVSHSEVRHKLLGVIVMFLCHVSQSI